MAGRPKSELVLMLVGVDVERSGTRTIACLGRRRKTAQALALRSRIVLACAGGAENQEVAVKLAVARSLRPVAAGRLAGRTALWGAAHHR